MTFGPELLQLERSPVSKSPFFKMPPPVCCGVIVTDGATLWLVDGLVPVMVIAELEPGALAATVRVRVVLPPAMTDAGLNA